MGQLVSACFPPTTSNLFLMKAFPYLYAAEYEHPFDRQALDRLENTRGIRLVSKKVLDHGLEKYLLMRHTGDNLQITPQTIPELYMALEKACELLAMKALPELFLFLDDKIKSFTIGESRQVIAISSGAVELLNEEEMLFFLGRELGHIRSNHVLYHMMATSIRAVSQLIGEMSLGIGNLLSMPLRMALLHWHRMSEFTADRAGLLTCQNPEVAMSTLIKISGLPARYYGWVSSAEFRRQARAFDDIQESHFDKFIRFAAKHESDQPFTIIRASQLFQWIEAGDYERILEKDRLEGMPPDFHCTNRNCPFPFEEEESYCRECGMELSRLRQPAQG